MKTLKILTIILISALTIMGCKKDDTKKDGLSQSIHNIVPDSIITNMKNLGMPINEGSTPPDLENIYLVTPFILKATTVPYDYEIGYQFSNYLFKFYDQNNSKLSVKLDYKSGSESGTGTGGFISGSNNSFSVFAKMRVTNYSGDTASVIEVLSGTIVSNGIKNFYFANFMLNNYGGDFMGNGKGRVLYDSDGTSEEQSTFSLVVGKNLKSAGQKSISSK